MRWWWKRKEQVAAAEPPRVRAKARQPATLEGLSVVLKEGLEATHHAVDQCSRTQGDQFADARRQLRQVRDEAMTTIGALVSAEPPDSRLRRMAWLATDEIWEMAERWLSLKATLAHRVPMTTEELSSLQRDMWMAAERAATDCRDARGRELVAAQERLRRIVDEANAFKATLSEGTMSQRQALMWQLVIEEVTEFAGEALER